VAKQTRQEKARDRLIQQTYSKYGGGVQISILDIPLIYKIGHAALIAGLDLDEAIQAAIAQFRQN